LAKISDCNHFSLVITLCITWAGSFRLAKDITNMGGTLSAGVNEPTKTWPHQYEVDHRSPPKFDPMLGFPKGRKERGNRSLTYRFVPNRVHPVL